MFRGLLKETVKIKEASDKIDSFTKLIYASIKMNIEPQETVEFIKRHVSSYDIAAEVESEKHLAELERAKEDPKDFQKVLMDWVIELRSK